MADEEGDDRDIQHGRFKCAHDGCPTVITHYYGRPGELVWCRQHEREAWTHGK